MKNITWSFQRKTNSVILSVHALSCFSRYLQKVRSNKTNKKQFSIIEKGKYVMPNQIFEAFVGIADDLTMRDDEYLQLIERSKM